MKYSKKLINDCVECIKQGMGYTKTAEACGISRDTFNEWMNGNLPVSAFRNCKTDEEREAIKSDFSDTIKKAKEERLDTRRAICEAAIINATPKNWQAAAWFLERNFPEEYGRQRAYRNAIGEEPAGEERYTIEYIVPPVPRANY